MKETYLRSLTKAISWRLFATITTMTIVLIFTGRIGLMVGVGLTDVIFRLILYYLHERIWNKIRFGHKITTKTAF